MSSRHLTKFVEVYSRLPVSQIFWYEMEQVLIAKSSNFKTDKESLLRIVRSFKGRNNETFWQVYSKLLVQIAGELS